MQEFVTVTGIVIKAEPIGEYDKRVVILTKERGKIVAFARGARKTNNRLMAPTNPFSFGVFRLFAGRSSYNMSEAEISNYFEELRQDFVGAYYGMYFLEVCDYYTRENNDETGMLKLLYQSLRALTSQHFDNRLVQCVFELKSIMINGEFPQITSTSGLSETAIYTIDYIMRTPVEKLFSFRLEGQILEELAHFSSNVCKRLRDKNVKSLEIASSLTLGEKALKITTSGEIEILKDFSSKVLETIAQDKPTASVIDAIASLRIAHKQNVSSDKIRSILYALLVIPFFVPLCIAIISYYIPSLPRYGNLTFISFVCIIGALAVWGLFFSLSQLSVAGLIYPEIGLLLPMGILFVVFLWHIRYLNQKFS